MTSLLDLPKDMITMLARYCSHDHRTQLTYALACKRTHAAMVDVKRMQCARNMVRYNNTKRLEEIAHANMFAELYYYAESHACLDAFAWLYERVRVPPQMIHGCFIQAIKCKHVPAVLVYLAHSREYEETIAEVVYRDNTAWDGIYQLMLMHNVMPRLTHYNLRACWKYIDMYPHEEVWRILATYPSFPRDDVIAWCQRNNYTPTRAYHEHTMKWMIAAGYMPALEHGDFDQYKSLLSVDLSQHQSWVHDQIDRLSIQSTTKICALLQHATTLPPHLRKKLALPGFVNLKPDLFALTDEDWDAVSAKFDDAVASLQYHPHDYAHMVVTDDPTAVLAALYADLEMILNMRKYEYRCSIGSKKFTTFIIERRHDFVQQWLERIHAACKPYLAARLRRERERIAVSMCDGDGSDDWISEQEDSNDCNSSNDNADDE